MSMIVMQQEVSNKEYTFLGLPLDFHIRAWDGINVDGDGKFVSLTDLTGNGYDFTRHDPAKPQPEIVPFGINGVQALRFDGSNNIGHKFGDIQSDRFGGNIFHFIVYKIEVVTRWGWVTGFSRAYNVFGAYSALRSPNASMQQVVASSSTFMAHTAKPSVNSHYALLIWSYSGKKSSLNGSDFLIGSHQFWDSRYWSIGRTDSDTNIGSKMLFCEAGAMSGNLELITQEKKEEFEAYFLEKYGLSVFI